MATRASCGIISFSIDRYLPVMVAGKIVNPVMLPPGRAMLATNSLPIGSDTDTNTIGIVRVASISAVTTGVLWQRKPVGLRSGSLLADTDIMLESPPVYSYLIRRFSPTDHTLPI